MISASDVVYLPPPPCGAGLRFLDVSDNRFGDDAAKALARALHDDDTLKGLDLARNAVGQRGVCLGPLILPYPTSQWRRLVALKKAPLSHGGSAGVYDSILLGICHEREYKITTFIWTAYQPYTSHRFPPKTITQKTQTNKQNVQTITRPLSQRECR